MLRGSAVLRWRLLRPLWLSTDQCSGDLTSSPRPNATAIRDDPSPQPGTTIEGTECRVR